VNVGRIIINLHQFLKEPN
jgi:hypothetical protein